MSDPEAPRQPWGWSGTVADFLRTAAESEPVVSFLELHLRQLLGRQASQSQRVAWREELGIVRGALRNLCVGRPDATAWGLVFEFELPLEGGRRPDLVVLAGQTVLVLEFKSDHTPTPAALDQVEAYSRDLAEYHSASHHANVHPVLVLTRAQQVSTTPRDTAVCAPDQLAATLDSLAPASDQRDLRTWIEAPYEPLPSLIEAARLIFANEPLPHIKRAESARVGEAVDVLAQICDRAKAEGLRSLALLAGVPGSGKTLAGLQLVYQRVAGAGSVFLSGNGPLVEVLKDALQSKTFVQDLHKFITDYGRTERVPTQRVIVFDEAQRAWDRGYMQFQERGSASEPDLLVRIGERLDWCSLVGLVGDGQEIHSGEEAGIDQWGHAVRTESRSRWRVCGPERLQGSFDDLGYESFTDLDLTISLRSRRAELLHDWVRNLLVGELGAANRLAEQIREVGFPMYLTRDLVQAKDYVHLRYLGEPMRRYGIIASSRAGVFLVKHDVPADFPSTKKVRVAAWYNRGYGEPGAGSNLDTVVTEFACQGLELDMPLIAWGNDYVYGGSRWIAKPGRPRYPQQDSGLLRQNCYRVLLTRGRDGFVVYLPDDPQLARTEDALLAAGVRVLPG